MSVILASASKQREKLLAMTGIPFKVNPSHAREVSVLKKGCAHLVKSNALLKAREIVGRERNAIVIGADTVVYCGGQLILKPRDLKEAKKILRTLFSRPAWVYTGVAVIDSSSVKTLIDYEKTRIYMDPLTEEEIQRYHQTTSPLDKAGGFDIEGLGGLFINRIEGCYTNVIGLPMPKLRRMLKEFGVSLF